MSHTPGPWRWFHPDASAAILHGDYDDPMEAFILIAAGHECCAKRREEFGQPFEERNCSISNRSTRDADLQLIAAAPDLLAACKALIRGGSPAAWHLAEAAIAKAEGSEEE